MAEWTPEATEYLEGYLQQVSALARHQGDDADEIVSELRTHIVQESEDAAGAMVTVDHLRKVMAGVGSPEQVTNPETPFAAPQRPRKEDVPPAAPAPAPAVAQPPRARSYSGCWLALAVMVLLAIATPFVLMIAAIALPNLARSRTQANEAAVAGALKKLAAAQERFLNKAQHDLDGDGVWDYGTLDELREQHLIDGELAGGVVRGYGFTVEVTPSAAYGAPRYSCTAKPLAQGKSGFRTYSVDETGQVRAVRSQDLYRVP